MARLNNLLTRMSLLYVGDLIESMEAVKARYVCHHTCVSLTTRITCETVAQASQPGILLPDLDRNPPPYYLSEATTVDAKRSEKHERLLLQSQGAKFMGEKETGVMQNAHYGGL